MFIKITKPYAFEIIKNTLQWNKISRVYRIDKN